MSVVLLILKIIGILLLILLGAALLLLSAVLLVPVRYAISGEMQESVKIDIRVTWLLHLISWRAQYADGEFDSCLRILGIRKRQKQPAQDLEDELELEPFETGQADSKDAGEPGDKAAGGAKEIEQSEDKLPDMPRASDGTKHGKHAPESGILSRIGQFFSRIKEKFLKIRDILLGLPVKLRDIKGILFDEVNKIAVVAVFTELKYLLRHFKFRKIKTELQFCLGDPALTGQALGALCVMPFLYRYQCNVYPDFESDNLYVRGTFDIKGRARVIHTAVSLLRLWRKKEFRTVAKQILNRS